MNGFGRLPPAVLVAAAIGTQGCSFKLIPPEPPPPPGAILPTRVAIVGASLEVNRVTVDRCQFRGFVDSDRRMVDASTFGMVEGIGPYAKKRTRMLGANVMVAFIFETATHSSSVNGVVTAQSSSSRLRGKAVFCPEAEFELIRANAVVLDDG